MCKCVGCSGGLYLYRTSDRVPSIRPGLAGHGGSRVRSGQAVHSPQPSADAKGKGLVLIYAAQRVGDYIGNA